MKAVAGAVMNVADGGLSRGIRQKTLQVFLLGGADPAGMRQLRRWRDADFGQNPPGIQVHTPSRAGTTLPPLPPPNGR